MNDALRVLMLEEDTDDRYLTQEVLHDLGYHLPVHFCENSDQLFYLLEEACYKTLVLIDYNSSRESGLEVLKCLKAHEDFKKLPVVLLSDSTMDGYCEQCYANGASSFIKKPHTMEDTRNKIGTFFWYWLHVADV